MGEIALTRADRLRIILKCATELSDQPDNIARLLLKEFSGQAEPPEEFDELVEVLQGLLDEDLQELSSFLDDSFFRAWSWNVQAADTPLTLFLSYPDSSGKDEAFRLEEALEAYGVQAFVASHDVSPGQDWWQTITGNLDSCHALVAIGVGNYESRAFCQQEVGWVMARQRPILWLAYDRDSRSGGVARRYQALWVDDPENAGGTASQIARWCAGSPQLQRPLGLALVRRLANMQSHPDLQRLCDLLISLPMVAIAVADELSDVIRSRPDIAALRVPEEPQVVQHPRVLGDWFAALQPSEPTAVAQVQENGHRSSRLSTHDILHLAQRSGVKREQEKG